MFTSQFFIFITIAVLMIIALSVILQRRHSQKIRLTPTAGLAFGFVLAGLFFGDERILGYVLMGIGVVLAVIDIIYKSRNR